MKKTSLNLVLLLTVIITYGNISNSPARPLNNADSLVAYYPFNGNANDESGNGNNSIYIGPGVTFTSDRFEQLNKAYYFDGNESSYIRIPADNFPTTDRTISFWFYTDQLDNHPTPLSYGGEVCHNSFILIINKGDFPNSYTALAHCGTNFITAPYSVPPLNNWYFFTMTISGTTQKVFINGELQQIANTFSIPTVVAGKSVILGALIYTDGNTVYTDPTAGAFQGKLDDFRFYNSAMTDSEVLNLYNNEAIGIVAYYPFTGNANDESGNGNHGTMIGTLTSTADRYGNEGKAYKFWHPDYISVPTNSSFFTNEFTVSYWYKVASYWGERGVISCVGNNGGYQQYFTGTNFAYLIGYDFPNGNSYFSSNYTVDDQPNIWHHNTVTYQKTGENLSVSKFYINGELMKTDNQNVAIAYPGEEYFNLGKNVDVNFNGELDEMRFYSRALTDQEIKDLFLTETKPVLQYPENQSSITTLTPIMLWISPLTDAEFSFQLSTDSLFGSILHEAVTNNFSTQLPDALLLEGQNYYWRVRSTLNGETGPWSEVWSFNFLNTGLKSPVQIPTFFTISPNPADASVKISYSVPMAKTGMVPVSIELLNSIGVISLKITEKTLMPGKYELKLETTALQTGIYYCRLKAGDYSQVRKLVIIH